ncbi:MAG: pyridoxamine 5'-phosphate oxidase family protein [Actinobacteria bacterium]|nr:pyridoxamine 5'-phosphate oxidase family protein [Actinomycetota bacterium]
MTGNGDQTAQELNQPGAQDLLRTQSLARLAYSGTDGTPRVVPIGFWWTGDEIVMCTATTAPKVRALRARPPVALSIDTNDARALQVRGTAEIDVVDGIPDEYLKASFKGIPDEAARQEFEANVRKTYPQMARISVRPAWARYYDFGTGRLPEFLSELVGG